MLQCRRCQSFRLISLSKKSPADNDVFRCQECGFLFSPASVAESHPVNEVRGSYQTGPESSAITPPESADPRANAGNEGC